MKDSEKRQTALEYVCQVLEKEKRDLLPLLLAEWMTPDELTITHKDALNVSLTVTFSGLLAAWSVSYCPADGHQQGDYNINSVFQRKTAIRVFDMMSRQLIDCRRIIRDAI